MGVLLGCAALGLCPVDPNGDPVRVSPVGSRPFATGVGPLPLDRLSPVNHRVMAAVQRKQALVSAISG
ncbi:hypothetical protein LJR267_000133 [Paraburkholderia hospita]|uniref:hypothetical protein n=1 Tax=Paraburkholderia hospita TaxID=169430 RepID=UPI003ECEE008